MKKPFLRSTPRWWLFAVLMTALSGGAFVVSAADKSSERQRHEAAAEASQPRTPAKREAAPKRRGSDTFAPSRRLPVDSPVSLPADI